MQEDIVAECRKHDIAVTAYAPLGSDQAPLMEESIVKQLAQKYQVSPANILLSLQVNRPSMSGMMQKTSLAPGFMLTRTTSSVYLQSFRSPRNHTALKKMRSLST